MNVVLLAILGFIILIFVFSPQIRSFLLRFLPRYKKYVLFLGYDDIIVGLIKQMEATNEKSYYLIQTAREELKVKHLLMAQLPDSVRNRISVVFRHIYTDKDFSKLNIPNTRNIFILGEQNSDKHDSDNIRYLNLLAAHWKGLSSSSKKGRKAIDVSVMFQDKSIAAIYQNRDMSRELRDHINITSFNFAEKWAQKVFIGDYPDLDFEPLTEESDKFVHLVVVGMNQMGVAMGIECMRIAHYANYKKHKTRITFLDADMKRQKDIFTSRYASLAEAVDVYDGYSNIPNKGLISSYTDIELHFIEDTIESNSFRGYLSHIATKKDRLLTVAICMNDNRKALNAALYLPDKVLLSETTILVKQDSLENALSTMEIIGDDKYKKIRFFGMKYDCIDLNLSDNIVPKLINYIYLNCYNFDQKPDPTLQELDRLWAELRMIQKWSNHYKADHIPTKKRIYKYTEGNQQYKMDLLANVEHNRWIIEKLISGFSKPDDRKDTERLRDAKDFHYLNQMMTLNPNYPSPVMNTWDVVRPLIDRVESEFEDDRLVPFRDLTNHDKVVTLALVRSIPWLFRVKSGYSR